MPPDKEKPPALGGYQGALDNSPTSWSVLAPTPQIAARRRWAYRLIRRCADPPPVYGSQGWLALPEGAPAKIAAVVTAAESWAQAGDDLETELRWEIDAARLAHKQAEDADYQARSQAHRAEWSRRTRPAKSFVERRAEQLESAKPRPGDHTGRGSA